MRGCRAGTAPEGYTSGQAGGMAAATGAATALAAAPTSATSAPTLPAQAARYKLPSPSQVDSLDLLQLMSTLASCPELRHP